ncbi:Clathrin interactor [Echinococcus granulosus]|uniref:Clathrin interactor n=1 Tax=Echinococcus granulosus TaxID=6210 RepID=W6UIW7_ECHGR|nr:Clathrin interactor [Echinococcus granulosus]EUB61101.1 Clathrin interactor [Echinococcus granulosus]
MFREYLEKGKVWVDKITSAVMNYTELENKVREATNDEPWGPHGKILNDLARETHDTEGLLEIMTMLLSRIFPENSTNWRRIYKGLVVLAHLLRSGSERVCDIALDNIYNLRSLENYQCVDERGRDQGSSVRIKAHEVVELLQDAEFLQAERQKALTARKDYAGIGNSHVMGSNFSGDYGMYEEDPHKVSEEVFSFPGATVDQPEEEEYNSYRRTSDTSKLSPTTQTSQKSLPTATPAALIDFDLPPTGSNVTDLNVIDEDQIKMQQWEASLSHEVISTLIKLTHYLPSEGPHNLAMLPPTRLPRPPSTEMLASPPRNRQNDDNSDFFAELDKHQAKLPQNAATTAMDLFANFTAVNPPVAAQTTPTAGAPVDADFGDFSSFQAAPVSETPAKTVTITTTSSQSTKQSVDPLFDEFTSPPPPSTFAHTAMTTALTPSTVPLQPQKPSSTVVNSTPEHQISGRVPSAPSNVGKTWSGLGAFNLDIDFKIAAASPTKPAAPSLSQLQSLKQNKLVTQPVLPQTNSCGAAFDATSPGSSKMDDFSNFAVFK